MKTCILCKVTKAKSEFSPRPERKCGVRSKCKKCNATLTSEWRHRKKLADPKGYKEMLRRHHLNRDPERVKELKRESYKRCVAVNPEKFREERREWWVANKEKARASSRKWSKSNPLKRQEHCRAYQAKKLGVTIEHVDREEIFKRDSGHCQICTKELDKTAKNGWHLDHIMPISKGGNHSMANVQVLCPSCNISKGAKILPQNASSNAMEMFR